MAKRKWEPEPVAPAEHEGAEQEPEAPTAPEEPEPVAPAEQPAVQHIVALTPLTYPSRTGHRREVLEGAYCDDMPEDVARKAEAAGLVRIERE